ncbi:hypothetical protein [Pseudomonas khavaziana]|uniref:hypothetical protein n=1 Tax=Pseudomonas khavaziana TaxID=2842351 RepID=UPI001C3C678D|nr:hypothetical protein [Pseudomonas khavaziana]MBV4480020.1 hypothetical protein [Pseudomonas khavaziana]
MSTNETPTSIPPELDRITVVLRPQEGSTLNQVHQFVGTGLIVAIGRGLGVLEHYCQGDAIQRLGEARELHLAQIELYEAALGAPAHLAANAQEMFDLLHRINVKVGGLNAVLGHGGEPSEQMWDESHQAMDAIWDLLDKVKSAEVFGSPSSTTGIPVVTESMHIDERVRMAANAKRYEWLRDVAFDTPRQDLVPRAKSGNMLIEQELDSEVDGAMRVYPGAREDEPCAD